MGEFGVGGLAKPFGRWMADTEQAFLLALRASGQVRRRRRRFGRARVWALFRRTAKGSALRRAPTPGPSLGREGRFRGRPLF